MELAHRDLDELEAQDDLDTGHGDEEGEHVGAQDRRVAREGRVRDRARQAEATALQDEAKDDAGGERGYDERPVDLVHARMLAEGRARGKAAPPLTSLPARCYGRRHAIHARGDASVRGHVARTARRHDGDGRVREWRRRASAPLGGDRGSARTVCRASRRIRTRRRASAPDSPNRSRRSTPSKPSCSPRRRPCVKSWISSRRRSVRSPRRCASCASRSRRSSARPRPPRRRRGEARVGGRARGIAREAVRIGDGEPSGARSTGRPC